ncbi:MAG: TIGR02300 family protein [Alphaproteobacteria bacterium]
MPELEEEYGTKRICQNCAARYYDLKNEPPVCPSCGTEYDPEAVMRSRRGRVAAAAVASAKDEVSPDVELEDAAKPASDDDEDDEDEEVTAVALDEVDEDTLEDGDTDLVIDDDGEVSLDDEFGEEDDNKVDDDTLLDDDDEELDGAITVDGLDKPLDEDS